MLSILDIVTTNFTLLKYTKKLWQLVMVLVFLCFFFSMFITNDVALLTFVPFTVMVLEGCDRKEAMIPTIILQTVAANLGSMMTPIGNPQNLYLYEEMGCGVGQFVLNNCSQFGFIIRYPYGAEDITGFSYEPWHIRYVGYPHAQIISDSHLTLEEYLDSFEVGSWYSYDSYYIARLPEDELQIPQELSGYDITVSPDNTGFIVVTINTAT